MDQLLFYTKLGYILSGPMANNCDFVTNTITAITHSLRVQSGFLAPKLLKDNFSEFFDVKGNVHSDFALYHFNKITRFKSCTYKVKFPLKETYDMLGDNYLNCKRGLKN